MQIDLSNESGEVCVGLVEWMNEERVVKKVYELGLDRRQDCEVDQTVWMEWGKFWITVDETSSRK